MRLPLSSLIKIWHQINYTRLSLISAITDMKDKFLSTFRSCSLRRSNALWVFLFLVFHCTPITNAFFFFSTQLMVSHFFFPYEGLNTILKLKDKMVNSKTNLDLNINNKLKHHNPVKSSLHICFSQIPNFHNYLNFYSP